MRQIRNKKRLKQTDTVSILSASTPRENHSGNLKLLFGIILEIFSRTLRQAGLNQGALVVALRYKMLPRL
jgi:hypothetical protein